VQVPGLTGIVQVSANDPSFAVRFTGAVFAWGRNGNDSGVLGLGATGDVATPTHGWMFAVAMQAPPPPSAVVPNLSGDSRSQAGQALQAVGLVLGTVSTVVDNSCNNLGTVLSQSPAAGAHVSLGSAVSITVGTLPKHPCP
jgi:serine/threonine-protein kinase